MGQTYNYKFPLWEAEDPITRESVNNVLEEIDYAIKAARLYSVVRYAYGASSVTFDVARINFGDWREVLVEMIPHGTGSCTFEMNGTRLGSVTLPMNEYSSFRIATDFHGNACTAGFLHTSTADEHVVTSIPVSDIASFTLRLVSPSDTFSTNMESCVTIYAVK